MAIRPALAKFLNRHRVVAADSMVFIYHLQNHPRYGAATRMILRSMEARPNEGVTSVITLVEVLAGPLQKGDLAAVEEYRRTLTSLPNLRLLDVSRTIAEGAAKLRAVHGLPLPDAIHAATAMAAGATGLVSNDSAFRRVKGIEVLILDDVVPARP